MADMNIILIIEDDEAHIQLMKRAFKPFFQEFKLIIAEDLKSARDELRKGSPDLIIGDLNLPDGQCIELLDEKREKLECPMVVLTGQGDEESAVKIMKAGALDYMVKSVDMLQNIPQVVKRALREWQHIRKHKQAIEALKQSEEKYRTIVEEASDIIFIMDTSGKILDINISGTKNLKYSYNDVLKFNIKEILLKADDDNDDPDFGGIATGDVVLKEYYFKCQDDNTIPFEISFRKLLNGKIIAIARNIEMRKIHELEGKRSREELERFNRLAVNREIRMIDLKKEVNNLLAMLGQHEKYKIHNPHDILVMD